MELPSYLHDSHRILETLKIYQILWQLEATARTGSVALSSLLPQLTDAVDRRLDAER